MDKIFQSEPIPYFNRIFKGFIKPFLFVWTIWLILFLLIMRDNHLGLTLGILSLLTILFATLTIPKFRYLLNSIEIVDNSFVIKYMDYNMIKKELLSVDELNIELKYAWERGMTIKLLFFNNNKLLFTIFAKKQNDKYKNDSFRILYDKIIHLKSNIKGSAQHAV
jgi:hypothetical protein